MKNKLLKKALMNKYFALFFTNDSKKCKIATKSATWITMKKLFKLTETKLKLNIFLNNKNWNKQIHSGY